MVVRFAVIMGAAILATRSHAVRPRAAQYIINYQTRAEAEEVRARLELSDYEVVRDSPDLMAILVRGPVGIERVRALAKDLVVERSSKVSTASLPSCSRKMTED